MDNNPSPGNKKGGLTTILEKSLGAAAKGGTTPLTGVYKYAEPVTAKGFTFMDSPGYDPASVTGQIAVGLQSRGLHHRARLGLWGQTRAVAQDRHELRDVRPDDRGHGLRTRGGSSRASSVEQVGREIYETLLRVASGEQTKSEAQGLGDYEFVPWQIGAVM